MFGWMQGVFGPYWLLVLATMSLGLGPFVYVVLGRVRWVLSLLDGFAVVVVCGFALLDILPHAYGSVGLWVIVGVLLGVVFSVLMEHSPGWMGGGARGLMWLLLGLGLALHAAIDGVALAVPQGVGSADSMWMAILSHRLPMGLVIWLTFFPVWGRLRAFLALLGVAFATGFGFVLGGGIYASLSGVAFAMFQSWVVGFLLHILWHRPRAEHEGEEARKRLIAGWSGALLGVGLVAVFFLSHKTSSHDHEHHHGHRHVEPTKRRLEKAPHTHEGHLHQEEKHADRSGH